MDHERAKRLALTCRYSQQSSCSQMPIVVFVRSTKSQCYNLQGKRKEKDRSSANGEGNRHGNKVAESHEECRVCDQMDDIRETLPLSHEFRNQESYNCSEAGDGGQAECAICETVRGCWRWCGRSSLQAEVMQTMIHLRHSGRFKGSIGWCLAHTQVKVNYTVA